MLKKMKQKLKNERGLTLVELLAVVVILAIIAIIAFVFIGGIIDNSKKDAHISNAQQIIAAAKLHEATGGGFDEPVPVGDIDSDGSLQSMSYLDEVLDPWTKDEYGKIKDANVTKEGNDLKINNFEASEGCKIDGETESELSKKDRDELCGE